MVPAPSIENGRNFIGYREGGGRRRGFGFDFEVRVVNARSTWAVSGYLTRHRLCEKKSCSNLCGELAGDLGDD
jgi:hypothetical protein